MNQITETDKFKKPSELTQSKFVKEKGGDIAMSDYAIIDCLATLLSRHWDQLSEGKYMIRENIDEVFFLFKKAGIDLSNKEKVLENLLKLKRVDIFWNFFKDGKVTKEGVTSVISSMMHDPKKNTIEFEIPETFVKLFKVSMAFSEQKLSILAKAKTKNTRKIMDLIFRSWDKKQKKMYFKTEPIELFQDRFNSKNTEFRIFKRQTLEPSLIEANDILNESMYIWYETSRAGKKVRSIKLTTTKKGLIKSPVKEITEREKMSKEDRKAVIDAARIAHVMENE